MMHLDKATFHANYNVNISDETKLLQNYKANPKFAEEYFQKRGIHLQKRGFFSKEDELVLNLSFDQADEIMTGAEAFRMVVVPAVNNFNRMCELI